MGIFYMLYDKIIIFFEETSTKLVIAISKSIWNYFLELVDVSKKEFIYNVRSIL